MPWYLFALLAALFDAAYYTAIKKLLKGVDQFILGSGAFLCAALILLSISWMRGIPDLAPHFWQAAIITAFLNTIAASLYYKVLKHTDISLALPMISFTPLFLIANSWLILGELPGRYGVAGILLIVVGSYVLNLPRNPDGFFAPFKAISRNHGSLAMISVAFLFSVSSNFDKLVVLRSDPYFGSAMVLGMLGISFATLARVTTKKERVHASSLMPKFILIGALLAVIAITANIALTLQIVPYVISLKRLSIVFAVVFGALLFKEKQFLNRSLGALIMFVGVVIILLFHS